MFRSSLALFLSLPLAVLAADSAVWATGYDAATQTRFIPVELWTGAEWDGKREIRMGKAELVFGDRAQKRIVGPIAYTRPGESVPIQVYERWQRGKKQLFAISSRGDGLGRVYDSRYERNCVDEVKFPLGLWKQGEKRVYEIPCDGGRFTRRLEVTILNLDYSYGGNPHSLQFHWLMDGGKHRGTDMRYVYSPGLGQVRVEGDE
jgi:hypothetical protein